MYKSGSPHSPEIEEDLRLLNAIANDDRKALSKLYDRYWNQLLRVAYQKVRSHEVAEELVQNLFIKLWEGRKRFQIQRVDLYLFAALKFAIIDYIRHLTRQEEFTFYYESFVSEATTDTEDQLAHHDLINAVQLLLAQLPVKTQEVFRLCRFEDLSTEEAAYRLQLTEKTVEYHLTKALKVLREHLHEYAYLMPYFILLFS
ncbi:RNA polymerase sigma-70 factor (ECF subfamily) [Larkinella arboricola]|uniref:RNA polymerase sigma-70 factor (ECF subfamily) n=1 Tax=Larkinella arboricola TaxID=643671 RepID=A0A327X8S3_LARAB|nr:RNA polymerase sigma-70 factor [Larkinella arboricola]RAK02648.1 RNA polymerase sigma-70 factor (ECF subfamily) [Larkinella arboricola]